ncbi:putative Dynein heavy chain, N-terminal region 2 [Blattamonas nauphoetae]|uniref:Dynein heavy chain, N-terminal region 2 n=1 Tax=Blattamonas nauphoetae TaxID=2049346 RepID=A0ABQ9Y331_9EUKA|nr:putative Dynein heavy chain, N-terminal region 2 [Blattamonas nauphoetae]
MEDFLVNLLSTIVSDTDAVLIQKDKDKIVDFCNRKIPTLEMRIFKPSKREASRNSTQIASLGLNLTLVVDNLTFPFSNPDPEKCHIALFSSIDNDIDSTPSNQPPVPSGSPLLFFKSMCNPYNFTNGLNIHFYFESLGALSEQSSVQTNTSPNSSPSSSQSQQQNIPLHAGFVSYPFLKDPTVFRDYSPSFSVFFDKLCDGRAASFSSEVYTNLSRQFFARQVDKSPRHHSSPSLPPVFLKERDVVLINKFYRSLIVGMFYDRNTNVLKSDLLIAALEEQIQSSPLIIARLLCYLFGFLISSALFICTDVATDSEFNSSVTFHLDHPFMTQYQSYESFCEEVQTSGVAFHASEAQSSLSMFLPVRVNLLHKNVLKSLELTEQIKDFLLAIQKSTIMPVLQLEGDHIVPKAKIIRGQSYISQGLQSSPDYFEQDSPLIHYPETAFSQLPSPVNLPFEAEGSPKSFAKPPRPSQVHPIHSSGSVRSFASLYSDDHSMNLFYNSLSELVHTTNTRISFFSDVLSHLDDFSNIHFFSSSNQLPIAYRLRSIFTQTINAMKLCCFMTQEIFSTTQQVLTENMNELEREILKSYQNHLTQLQFSSADVSTSRVNDPIKTLITEWMEVAQSSPKHSSSIQSFVAATGLVAANALQQFNASLIKSLNPKTSFLDSLFDIPILRLVSSSHTPFLPSLPFHRRRLSTRQDLPLSTSTSVLSTLSESSVVHPDSHPIPTFRNAKHNHTFYLRHIPEGVAELMNIQFMERELLDPNDFISQLSAIVHLPSSPVLSLQDGYKQFFDSFPIQMKKLRDSHSFALKTLRFRKISSLTQLVDSWHCDTAKYKDLPVIVFRPNTFTKDENDSPRIDPRFYSHTSIGYQPDPTKVFIIPDFNLPVHFMDEVFEMSRLMRLVKRDRSIAKLFPPRQEWISANRFTTSLEFYLMNILHRRGAALRNVPPHLAALYKVPVTVVTELNTYDFKNFTFANNSASETQFVMLVRNLFFEFHDIIVQRGEHLDTLLMKIAQMQFISTSTDSDLKSHGVVEQQTIQDTMYSLRQSGEELEEAIQDIIEVTLDTANQLILHLAEQKKFLQTGYISKKPSALLIKIRTDAAKAQKVFLGDAATFNVIRTASEAIFSQYWDLFIQAIHMSILSTFKSLNAFFAPVTSAALIEALRDYPKVKINVKYNRTFFSFTPTMPEFYQYLTATVAQFFPLMRQINHWDFNYAARVWRLESPDQILVVPVAPEPQLNTTVWDELSASRSVIKMTFSFLSGIPNVPSANQPFIARFCLMESLLMLDPSSLLSRLSLVMTNRDIAQDNPTFTIPSSFALVSAEERAALNDRLYTTRQGQWMVTPDQIVETITTPNLEFEVIPSSFVSDPTSPTRLFIPDEHPYSCPFCEATAMSFVSLTNHIHKYHSAHTHEDVQMALFDAMQTYLVRSIARLQVWREAFCVLNITLGSNASPNIPPPTNKVHVPKPLLSILRTLFSPVIVTVTLVLDFYEFFLPQMYDIVNEAIQLFEQAFSSNTRLYILSLVTPLRKTVSQFVSSDSLVSDIMTSQTKLNIKDSMLQITTILRQIEQVQEKQIQHEQQLLILQKLITNFGPLNPAITAQLQAETAELEKLNGYLPIIQLHRPTLHAKHARIMERLNDNRNTLNLSMSVVILAYNTILPLLEKTPMRKGSIESRRRMNNVFIETGLVHIKYWGKLNKQERLLDTESTDQVDFETIIVRIRYFGTLFQWIPKYLEFEETLKASRFGEVDTIEKHKTYGTFIGILKHLRSLRHLTSPSLRETDVERQFSKKVDSLRGVFETIFDINRDEFRQRHWLQLATDLVLPLLRDSTIVEQGNPTGTPTIGVIIDSRVYTHKQHFLSLKARAHMEAVIENDLNKIVKRWTEEEKLVLIPFAHSNQSDFFVHSTSYEDGFNSDDETDTGMTYTVTESSILDVITHARQSIEKLQTLSASKLSHPFIKTIKTLLSTLTFISDPLSQLYTTQKLFVSLSLFYSSPRNSVILHKPLHEFLRTSQVWNQIISQIKTTPTPYHSFAEGQFIVQLLSHVDTQFDEHMDALTDFIQTQRHSFPQLGLLSEADAIEVLSHASSPAAFHRFISTFFPNITSFAFIEIDSTAFSSYTSHTITPSNFDSPRHVPNASNHSVEEKESVNTVFADFVEDSAFVDHDAESQLVSPRESMSSFGKLGFDGIDRKQTLSVVSLVPFQAKQDSATPRETLDQFRTTPNINYQPSSTSGSQHLTPGTNTYNTGHTIHTYLVTGVYGVLGEFLKFEKAITYTSSGDTVQFLCDVEQAIILAVKAHTVKATLALPTAFFPHSTTKSVIPPPPPSSDTDFQMPRYRISEDMLESGETIGHVVALLRNLFGMSVPNDVQSLADYLQKNITQTVFFSFFSFASYIIHSNLNSLQTHLTKVLSFSDHKQTKEMDTEIHSFIESISNRCDWSVFHDDTDLTSIKKTMQGTEFIITEIIKRLQSLIGLLHSPLDIVKAEQAIVALMMVMNVYALFHQNPTHGGTIAFENCGSVANTFPITLFDNTPFLVDRFKKKYGHHLQPPVSSSQRPITSQKQSPYESVAATVMFGHVPVRYGFEYLGKQLSAVEDWNMAVFIQPKIQFEASTNISLITSFFRAAEFWQSLAQCVASVVPPSFMSRMSSSKSSHHSTKRKMGNFSSVVGPSPFTIDDRLREFGIICGKNIRHLMANSESSTNNTLPSFIEGIVGCGQWGLIEGMENLPHNFMNQISFTFTKILEAVRDDHQTIQLSASSHVKLKPGFFFFTDFQTRSKMEEIPADIRAHFRPIPIPDSDSYRRLYMHFVLNAFTYSYQLTARVMVVYEELSKLTVRSEHFEECLITHLSHTASSYAELVTRAILPVVEAMEGMPDQQIPHPLLQFLTNNLKSVNITIKDTDLPPEKERQAVFDKKKTHLASLLTFIIENVAIVVSLLEFLKLYLSQQELLAMIHIIIKIFPEVAEVYLSPGAQHSGANSLLSNSRPLTTDWFKYHTPIEKRYLDDVMAFSTSFGSSILSYPVIYPQMVEELTSLDNVLPTNFTSKMNEFLVSSHGGRIENQLSGLFDLFTKTLHSSEDAETMEKQNVIDSLYSQTVTTHARHLMDSTVADISGERLKFITKMQARGGNTTLQFDRNSAAKSVDPFVATLGGKVVQLAEAIRHPLWSAPGLTQVSTPFANPIILLGPAGSGKTFLTHLLAMSQNACGIRTKVVHLTPSALSMNHLYGSYSSSADLVMDDVNSSTFERLSTTNNFENILHVNPHLQWEGAMQNRTVQSSLGSEKTEKHKWNRGLVEIVAHQLSQLPQDPQHQTIVLLDMPTPTRSSQSSFVPFAPPLLRQFGGHPSHNAEQRGDDYSQKWAELIYPLLRRSTRLEDLLQTSLYLSYLNQSDSTAGFNKKSGVVTSSATRTLSSMNSLLDRAVSIILAHDMKLFRDEFPYHTHQVIGEMPDTKMLQDSLNHLHSSFRNISLTNNTKVSFPPNVQFIIETDSLSSVPDYLLGICRVMVVPTDLFIQPLITTTSHLINPVDPLFARAHHIISQYLYTSFLMNSSMSASALMTSAMAGAFSATVSNTAVAFLRALQIGSMFLENYVSTPRAHATQSLPRCTFDNQRQRFFQNSILLFSVMINALIDKITLALVSKLVDTSLRDSTEQFIDYESTLENVIAYAVYWGVGGHLFGNHAFRISFSKKLCSLLSNPPQFRNRRDLKKSQGQKQVDADLTSMSQFLGKKDDSAVQKDSLFYYCVNLITGSWTLVGTLGQKMKLDKKQTRMHAQSISGHSNLSTGSSPQCGASPQITSAIGSTILSSTSNVIVPEYKMIVSPYSHVMSLYILGNQSILVGYRDESTLDRYINSIIRTPFTMSSSNDTVYSLFTMDIHNRTTLEDLHRLAAEYRSLVSRSRLQFMRFFETILTKQASTPSGPTDKDHQDTSISEVPFGSAETMGESKEASVDKFSGYGTSITYEQTNNAVEHLIPHWKLHTPVTDFQIGLLRLTFNRTTILPSQMVDNSLYDRAPIKVVMSAPVNVCYTLPPRLTMKVPLIVVPEMSMGDMYRSLHISFTQRLIVIISQLELQSRSASSTVHDLKDLPPPLSRIPVVTLMIYLFFALNENLDAKLREQISKIFPSFVVFPLSFSSAQKILKDLGSALATTPPLRNSVSNLAIEWIKIVRREISTRCSRAERVRLDVVCCFFASLIVNHSPFEASQLRRLVRELQTFDTYLGEEIMWIEDHKSEDHLKFMQVYEREDTSLGIFLHNHTDPGSATAFNQFTGHIFQRVTAALEHQHVFLVSTPHRLGHDSVAVIEAMSGSAQFHLHITSDYLHFFNQLRKLCWILAETDRRIIVWLFLDDVTNLEEPFSIFPALELEVTKSLSSDSNKGSTSTSNLQSQPLKGCEYITDTSRTANSPVSHTVKGATKPVDVRDVSQLLYTMVSSNSFMSVLFSENELKELYDQLISKDLISSDSTLNAYIHHKTKQYLRFLVIGDVYEMNVQPPAPAGQTPEYLYWLQNGTPESSKYPSPPTPIPGISGLSHFRWLVQTAHIERLDNPPINSLSRLSQVYVNPDLPLKLAYQAQKARRRQEKGDDDWFTFNKNDLAGFLILQEGDPIKHLTTHTKLSSQFRIEELQDSSLEFHLSPRSNSDVLPSFPPLTHPPAASSPIGPALISARLHTTQRTVKRSQTSKMPTLPAVLLTQSSQLVLDQLKRPITRQHSTFHPSSLGTHIPESVQEGDSFMSFNEFTSPVITPSSTVTVDSDVSEYMLTSIFPLPVQRMGFFIQLETQNFDIELSQRLNETIGVFNGRINNLDQVKAIYESSEALVDQFQRRSNASTPAFDVPKSTGKLSKTHRSISLQLMRPLVVIFDIVKRHCNFYSSPNVSTTSVHHRVALLSPSFLPKFVHQVFDIAAKRLEKLLQYRKRIVETLAHYVKLNYNKTTQSERIEFLLNGDKRIALHSPALFQRFILCQKLLLALRKQLAALQEHSKLVVQQSNELHEARTVFHEGYSNEGPAEMSTLNDIAKKLQPRKYDRITPTTYVHRSARAILQMIQILLNSDLPPVNIVPVSKDSQKNARRNNTMTKTTKTGKKDSTPLVEHVDFELDVNEINWPLFKRGEFINALKRIGEDQVTAEQVELLRPLMDTVDDTQKELRSNLGSLGLIYAYIRKLVQTFQIQNKHMPAFKALATKANELDNNRKILDEMQIVASNVRFALQSTVLSLEQSTNTNAKDLVKNSQSGVMASPYVTPKKLSITSNRLLQGSMAMGMQTGFGMKPTSPQPTMLPGRPKPQPSTLVGRPKPQSPILATTKEDPMFSDLVVSWLTLLRCIDQNIQSCFGDSLLAAAFVVFQSAMNFDQWEGMIEEWRQVLKAASIQFSDESNLERTQYINRQTPFPLYPSSMTLDVSSDPTTLISQLGVRQATPFIRNSFRPLWAVLGGPSLYILNQVEGIPPDDFLVMSSLVAQASGLHSVKCFIDPIGTASQWILNRLRIRTPVVVTSVLSTHFIEDTMDALLSGYPLIVEFFDLISTMNEDRAVQTLRILNELVDCCSNNPLSEVLLSGKKIALRDGFKLIIIVRDEAAFFPTHTVNFFSLVAKPHVTLINWAPFAVARSFAYELQYNVFIPAFDPPAKRKRQDLLLKFPPIVDSVVSTLSDLVSFVNSMRTTSISQLTALTMSYRQAQSEANVAFLSLISEITQSQKAIETRSILTSFVRDLFSINQLYTQVTISRWLSTMTIRNIILQPFRQTGAITCSNFFDAVLDSIIHILRLYVLNQHVKPVRQNSTTDLTAETFKSRGSLMQGAIKEYRLSPALLEYFRVVDSVSDSDKSVSLIAISRQFSQFLFDHVVQSYAMKSSGQKRASIPLPHNPAVNLILSFNTNMRLLMVREKMTKLSPHTFMEPQYLSHPSSHVISMPHQSSLHQEDNFSFNAQYIDTFRNLIDSYDDFDAYQASDEDDALITTRSMTITESNFLRFLRRFDVFFSSDGKILPPDQMKPNGFEMSFKNHRQEWLAFLNHPTPTQISLPGGMDNDLLPLERFLVYQQLFPQDGIESLYQMTRDSQIIGVLNGHTMEDIISRALMSTHLNYPLVLIAPPSLVSLQPYLERMITSPSKYLPDSLASSIFVAVYPSSVEKGNYTLVDYLAPLQIQYSSILWGPYQTPHVNVTIARTLFRTFAKAKLKNNQFPAQTESILQSKQPARAINKSWRQSPVDAILTPLLNSVLKSNFFVTNIYLSQDQFSISSFPLQTATTTQMSFQFNQPRQQSSMPKTISRHHTMSSRNSDTDTFNHKQVLNSLTVETHARFKIKCNLSKNMLKRHTIFMYGDSSFETFSPPHQLERMDLLISKQRFPTIPQRSLAQRSLILVRTDTHHADLWSQSTTSTNFGTFRHFERNWDQFSLNADLAQTIGWVPPGYEVQSDIPNWGRFCFNLCFVFTLFSLRLQVKRLFSASLYDMEDTAFESTQNGLTLAVENEMMSQATFLRVLSDVHSLLRRLFKIHSNEISSLSSRYVTPDQNSSNLARFLSPIFGRLKAHIQHEFIPLLSKDSPDILFLLYLVDCYFSLDMFNPDFDYLHPIAPPSSPNEPTFRLRKEHTGHVFERHLVMEQVIQGIPETIAAQLIGVDPVVMNASTIALMTRTKRLSKALIDRTDIRQGPYAPLPPLPSLPMLQLPSDEINQLIASLPSIEPNNITEMSNATPPFESHEMKSFLQTECRMNNIMISLFQTSLTLSKMVGTEPNRSFRLLPQTLDNLPLPIHVPFKHTTITRWIQRGHSFLSSVIESTDKPLLFDISLFSFPAAFFAAVKPVIYDAAVKAHRQSSTKRRQSYKPSVKPTTVSPSPSPSPRMELEPSPPERNLASISIPYEFLPPIQLSVASPPFNPLQYAYTDAKISLTFVPLNPLSSPSDVSDQIGDVPYSRGVLVRGIALHGFVYDFEANTFVHISADGKLPPTCTQYPLMWVSLSFASPDFITQRHTDIVLKSG